MKLSNRLGVEEHDRPPLTAFPKRKAGREVSAEDGLCGATCAPCVLLRKSEGRVTGRRRLKEMINRDCQTS